MRLIRVGDSDPEIFDRDGHPAALAARSRRSHRESGRDISAHYPAGPETAAERRPISRDDRRYPSARTMRTRICRSSARPRSSAAASLTRWPNPAAPEASQRPARRCAPGHRSSTNSVMRAASSAISLQRSTVRFRGPRAAQCQFRAGPDHRQRRAQLMGSVTGELRQRLHRSFETPQHRIPDLGEPL